MDRKLMYVELKTGYADDGPAWIGYVKFSKSGRTVYFNDHAFQKQIGCGSNYLDIENGESYWISGIKKNGSNRHWAGHGVIRIDRRAVKEFLDNIGEETLPNGYEVISVEDNYPIERINEMMNS